MKKHNLKEMVQHEGNLIISPVGCEFSWTPRISANYIDTSQASIE